ncbi:four-carbon acid sugar kinase family protein [Vampirovibrio sp.]|uniref:four-carbon acid sugar kinase family protein n=1 Tax=Vampirovibrio sp. TaxID=2717857 RepID=UPI0035935F33
MQIPGLSVGIVADDLTGACDTALQFFSAQAQTHILLDFQKLAKAEGVLGSDEENQVWSINTGSRHMDPLEAQALVRRSVAFCRDKLGVENFYKKIDSTLRGHIAHECLGMLDELKAQCAVIVPAYPLEGRRTVGGYQLVRGVPVEKTVVARDPLFPVRQSHVPTLLGQATKPGLVGHIPLSMVLHGAGPMLVKLKELIEEGKKLVVIDATSNEDLEQIALAIEKAQKYARVIPCGSAGLANALAALWTNQPEEKALSFKQNKGLSAPPSPILIVSGSTTDTSRQQALRLMENYPYYGQGSHLEIFELTPDQILGLSPLDELRDKLVAALGERNTVLLSSALKEETYARTVSLAKEHNLPEASASQQAQKVLSQLVDEVLQQKSVKLVLVGGETTCQVCNQLKSTQLEILAEADDSIPLSIDNLGRWIITKSGGFGTPLALANVVKFIKQHESTSVHA